MEFLVTRTPGEKETIAEPSMSFQWMVYVYRLPVDAIVSFPFAGDVP